MGATVTAEDYLSDYRVETAIRKVAVGFSPTDILRIGKLFDRMAIGESDILEIAQITIYRPKVFPWMDDVVDTVVLPAWVTFKKVAEKHVVVVSAGLQPHAQSPY